jgi:hypothetical protein
MTTREQWLANYEFNIKKEQAIAVNHHVRELKKENMFGSSDAKEIIRKQIYSLMTTCKCSDKFDVRGKCQPEDCTFYTCPQRLDTAKWLISNEYAKIEDFYYLKDEDKDDIEFYMTIHPCGHCSRECCFYDEDTRGPCGTRDCCKIMCYQCAYGDGDGTYYCQKCRDEMIETGEWAVETVFLL